MEENNIFDETISYASETSIDDFTDDYDGPSGPSGPMYQLNFGKEYIRVLLDSSIKLELPNSSIKGEFSARDYKTVISMMNDLKQMDLPLWKAKYFD